MGFQNEQKERSSKLFQSPIKRTLRRAMGKNREEKKEVAKVQPIDIARQAPTMILLNWKIKHTRIHTRQPRPSGQPVRCIIIITIITIIIIF